MEKHMELKKLTDDDIKQIASDAVDNAEDFVNSEIVDNRLKAQRYYDGHVDIGEEDGRSKVVATKIRDKIRAIKPSLMRVFYPQTSLLSLPRWGQKMPSLVNKRLSM